MKKFQLGDTYGKTTADILTNDDVSKISVYFSCDPLTPHDPRVVARSVLVPEFRQKSRPHSVPDLTPRTVEDVLTVYLDCEVSILGLET